MKQLYFLLFIILSTSCASLQDNPFQPIRIKTSEPATISSSQSNNIDSLYERNGAQYLSVLRGKDSLFVTASTDSSSITAGLKGRRSVEFYLDILYSYGLGLIVDKWHPSLWSYPSQLYFDFENNTYSRFPPCSFSNKWAFNFHLPIANNYQYFINNNIGRGNMGAGFGIGASLDYYYKNNRSLNFKAMMLNSGLTIENEDIPDFHRTISFASPYLSLSHRHHIKEWTLGYGLSFAYNNWTLTNGADFFFHENINYESVGLVFPAYYRSLRWLSVGLEYRPTFIRTGTDTNFHYEHAISLDFEFKIRGRK